MLKSGLVNLSTPCTPALKNKYTGAIPFVSNPFLLKFTVKSLAYLLAVSRDSPFCSNVLNAEYRTAFSSVRLVLSSKSFILLPNSADLSLITVNLFLTSSLFASSVLLRFLNSFLSSSIVLGCEYPVLVPFSIN